MNVEKINKKGWNELVSSGAKYSNTSLPNYGPYIQDERTLNLFKNVKNCKILELGCAKGDSLNYLKSKGASELWGIDISEKQVENAIKNGLNMDHLFVGEMSDDYNIPESYFDYVISIYSIGYASDLVELVKKVQKYLKINGKFIICWTHPFFECLDVADNKIFVSNPYSDKINQVFYKGEEEVMLVQSNYKFSTLINILIENGFAISKVIEPEFLDNKYDYDSPIFIKDKTLYVPSTLIVVAEKN